MNPAEQGSRPDGTAVSSTSADTSNEALLAQAQAQLLEVASAEFTNVRERTSKLLYTLAALSVRMGGGAEKQRQVEEIRFQAKRLERGDSAAFVRSVWVQKALLAALAALEASAYAERIPQLDDWIEVARDAANAIPDHTSVAFEQAPMQDALRATVSAFATAQLADRRDGSREAAPGEQAAGS